MPTVTFDPAKVHDHSYFVENIAASTLENRVSFDEAWKWARTADDGPYAGIPNDRRLWANVSASPEAWQVDERYNAVAEYDFIPYSPDPNAALGNDLSYPVGVRQQRVVPTLKSKDELRAIVEQRKIDVNAQLFPNNAIDQRGALAAAYRAKSIKSVEESAFLTDFDLRVAGMEANELVRNACFTAIEAGTEFSITNGTASHQWVTSIE
jgi:hypothetical protein